MSLLNAMGPSNWIIAALALKPSMTFVIQYMNWKPLGREWLKAIAAYKFSMLLSLFWEAGACLKKQLNPFDVVEELMNVHKETHCVSYMNSSGQYLLLLQDLRKPLLIICPNHFLHISIKVNDWQSIPGLLGVRCWIVVQENNIA